MIPVCRHPLSAPLRLRYRWLSQQTSEAGVIVPTYKGEPRLREGAFAQGHTAVASGAGGQDYPQTQARGCAGSCASKSPAPPLPGLRGPLAGFLLLRYGPCRSAHSPSPGAGRGRGVRRGCGQSSHMVEESTCMCKRPLTWLDGVERGREGQANGTPLCHHLPTQSPKS